MYKLLQDLCSVILSSRSNSAGRSLLNKSFPETVFFNFLGAQELMPMNRFRQPEPEFLNY
jgi:hypothetical protein